MNARTRDPCSTDLNDEPWAIVEPPIPPAEHGGRPREVDIRAVLNAVLYGASEKICNTRTRGIAVVSEVSRQSMSQIYCDGPCLNRTG